MDWRAKRTLDNRQARQGWEHHLLDDIYWQRSLHKHFSNDGAHASLFASNARRPYEGVQAALMEAFLQTRA